ncbi:hypothetical protein CC2G_009382 [Coprinopsis cinerea AmutBmut pab1-1]|nr:hypothetical protein CC2G_009382 [Coprinopsis cinerea AmutBmut pab1-1]
MSGKRRGLGYEMQTEFQTRNKFASHQSGLPIKKRSKVKTFFFVQIGSSSDAHRPAESEIQALSAFPKKKLSYRFTDSNN